ncbi:YeeE/YedE family protein [Acinetobacter sp. NIPH 2699]|uniref:YeeE/YedE family protein n=1 Tax=Acinetobacter sp. NIPH 2699 TaxID=2923433 RepID=UPI001F4A8AF9|nr:YeeE/YedE family protein [Acinetobacter sp. NIPH 2699]MCH7336100.1 YeeE/YedE family protein [Acinetobacter sp. NIPH 2699]
MSTPQKNIFDQQLDLPKNSNFQIRYVIALIILLLFLIWSYWLSQQYIQYSFGFISIIGALFGITLQRSRFCFYCIFTDFFENRDPRGIVGVLLALLVGTLGYHAVFGAFLPILDGRQLPPDAHIGIVSWVLPFSAFSFGFGMALSGSCISAQFYRLGEGLLTAPVALLGVFLGFAFGFISWNALYLNFMQSAEPLWLPNIVGYAASLLIQVLVIGGLILLGLYVIHKNKGNTQQQIQSYSIWQGIFQQRWPTWIGGIFVGVIGFVAYFRVGAIGVTAEIGSLSRTTLNHFWSVTRLEGLDRLTGCMTVVKETLLSNNGIFVISLIIGSLIAALVAGQFRLQTNTLKANVRIFLGGILMGWGAMLSLGCTVGVLLSGIMAGAVSGWVFTVFCLIGAWFGWWLRQKI